MSDLMQNQIFTPNLIDNQFEEIPQHVVQPPSNSYLMNSYGNLLAGFKLIASLALVLALE